jgi:CRISPR-associated protein Csx10
LIETDQTEGQYKGKRRQYFAFEFRDNKPCLEFGAPRQPARTHNTVEDARQKPTEAVGGVYTYEAIAAGELLWSEIRLRKGLFGKLPTLSEERVTIGRARKAGYGSVRLIPPTDPEKEQPRPAKAPAIAPSQYPILYLASDLLLPALLGIGAEASPATYIAEAVKGAIGRRVEVGRGAVRTVRTEGWIASWGLPRPSYVAIAAGSTIEIKPADRDPFSQAERDALEREGLGLRRGEGFGQVRVNPAFAIVPLKCAKSLSEPDRNDAKSPPPPARITEAAARDFAKKIENAALRAEIAFRAEQAAQARQADLGWTPGKPNMSQLGALRSVMARLASEDDLARTSAFVSAIKKTDRATRWGENALNRLQELLKNPIGIWEIDSFNDMSWQELLLIRGAAEARGDPELQRFAIANLLFAAMRQHKREIARPNQGGASWAG